MGHLGGGVKWHWRDRVDKLSREGVEQNEPNLILEGPPYGLCTKNVWISSGEAQRMPRETTGIALQEGENLY